MNKVEWLNPSAIFVKPQQWPTPSESIAIYCVRKLVSCITQAGDSSNSRLKSSRRFLLLLIRRDESQPLVLPLKTLTSIKNLWETRGMTYELLLGKNFFSMEILHSLLYRCWSVNFYRITPFHFGKARLFPLHVSLWQTMWPPETKATPNAMSNFVSQKCRMAVAIWVRWTVL